MPHAWPETQVRVVDNEDGQQLLAHCRGAGAAAPGLGSGLGAVQQSALDKV
jgi:hypothetical protein